MYIDLKFIQYDSYCLKIKYNTDNDLITKCPPQIIHMQISSKAQLVHYFMALVVCSPHRPNLVHYEPIDI